MSRVRPGLSLAVILSLAACAGSNADSAKGTAPDAAKADGLRKKAKDDLEKGCRSDDAESCGLAALVAERGGDIPGARKKYGSGCEGGDVLSCNNLARLDAEGLGGSADGAAALKKFNELCAAGDAIACNNAGVLESGWTAQVRYEGRGQAVYRFRCAEGMASGCASFGEAKKVTVGSGDLTKAIAPLTTACNGVSGQGGSPTAWPTIA